MRNVKALLEELRKMICWNISSRDRDVQRESSSTFVPLLGHLHAHVHKVISNSKKFLSKTPIISEFIKQEDGGVFG
jgi:hypothetical protein